MKLRNPEQELADIIAKVEQGERVSPAWPCQHCPTVGQIPGFSTAHLYDSGVDHPFALDVAVLRNRLIRQAIANNTFARVWHRYRPDDAGNDGDDESEACWEFWDWLLEEGYIDPEDAERIDAAGEGG